MSELAPPNQTVLPIEKGYPERQVLPDDQTSWERENLDYLPTLFPDAKRTSELLEAKGVVIPTLAEMLTVGSLSNRQAAEAYGENILSLRNPLGRTGINGTGIFWNAGDSAVADIAIGRKNEGALQLAFVYNRGKWSLPGGFLEKDEDTSNRTLAGLREGTEETGLDLFEVAYAAFQMTAVEVKPQSRRSVDFGFISNQVIGLLVPEGTIDETLQAGDDAEEAQWYTQAEITDLNMSSDHRRYANLAFDTFSRPIV